MKALLYLEPGKVEIADLPRPEIGAGEVLLRTRACGVCATDVKTFMRGHPLISRGSVLGHETTGEIAASLAPGWREGDRVAVAPYIACGECRFCTRGQFSLCERLWDSSVRPGGFAEFVRVPEAIVRRGMRRLTAADDLIELTLAEPLACCYHGFGVLGLRAGDTVLIIGDGPMGLLQAALARHLGAASVTLAGMTPERLAWARTRADQVVNVSTTDLREAAKAAGHTEGFDRVMVSIAQPDAVGLAISLARRGGSVNVFAGLPRDTRLSVDAFRIHYDEIALVGTFGFGTPDFAAAAEALSARAMDLDGYITRTVSLDGLEAAFVDSAAYRGIKTVAVFA